MRLRAGSHLVMPGSRHEILMEQDRYRAQFWAAFDAFVPGSPLLRDDRLEVERSLAAQDSPGRLVHALVAGHDHASAAARRLRPPSW